MNYDKPVIKYSRYAAMSGKGWQVGFYDEVQRYVVHRYFPTWLDALHFLGIEVNYSDPVWYGYTVKYVTHKYAKLGM